MERDKLALIILLATDVVIVLPMFFGLLRFRGRGIGMFGLARILWKQVTHWQFLVGAALSAFLMNILFARALSGSCFPQGQRSLRWRVQQVHLHLFAHRCWVPQLFVCLDLTRTTFLFPIYSA